MTSRANEDGALIPNPNPDPDPNPNQVSVDSNDPEGTVFISRQMQGAAFEVLTRWFPGS